MMTAMRTRSLLSVGLGLMLLVAAMSANLFSSHTNAAAETKTMEGRVEVVLAPDGYVVLPDGTRLTFNRVVSDSRCPIDAFCIWSGNVVTAFELQTTGGDPQSFELTFNGSPTTQNIEGYAVTLTDVQPDRNTLRPIDSNDYRVWVTITASDEETRIITYDDFGGTVEVNVGQTVIVDPDRDYVWRAQVDDPSILEPLPTIAIYPPPPPPFQAVAAGETTLHITREPICLGESPACRMPSQEYAVHVVVH